MACTNRASGGAFHAGPSSAVSGGALHIRGGLFVHDLRDFPHEYSRRLP